MTYNTTKHRTAQYNTLQNKRKNSTHQNTIKLNTTRYYFYTKKHNTIRKMKHNITSYNET